MPYSYLTESYRRDEVRPRPTDGTGCTCRSFSNTQNWRPLSFLHFRRIFRSQHFSFCPQYRSSEQSLHLMLQLVPPSWLLSHSIDLGIHMKNWCTSRAFSLSPIMVGTSRLVDRKTSPAFLAINRTRSALSRTGSHHIYISQLQIVLRDLFNQQKASPLDTDCKGNTLLSVSLNKPCVTSMIRLDIGLGHFVDI